MKLNPKMGFWRAKHGLSKHGLKRPKLVSNLGRAQKTYGKRRREEEEEEEIKQKGMELLTLSMELGFLVWILGFVWLMVCPKPRV